MRRLETIPAEFYEYTNPFFGYDPDGVFPNGKGGLQQIDSERSWGQWGRSGQAEPVHLFTDDYRIEVCWSRPCQGFSRAWRAGLVTAPDFSVFWDMPEAAAQWQYWRSAVVGRWWQDEGLQVIPVLQWTEKSFNPWIQTRSIVAVRGPASEGREWDKWRDGFIRCVLKIKPSAVLFVGGLKVNYTGVSYRLERVKWGRFIRQQLSERIELASTSHLMTCTKCA